MHAQAKVDADVELNLVIKNKKYQQSNNQSSLIFYLIELNFHEKIKMSYTMASGINNIIQNNL